MKIKIRKNRMGLSSDDLLYYSMLFLIILTCIPVTQGLPAVFRTVIQVFSIGLFIFGIILQNNGPNIFKYIFAVLFFGTYVYLSWQFKQGFFTCLYNVMASVQFCLYGAVINTKGLMKRRDPLIRIIIAVTIITTVTTILGLIEFPLAARELGRTVGYASTTGDFEEVKLGYRMRNIAGWSQIYGLAFLSPICLLLYKKGRNVFYLVCALLIEVCIVLSQITFAVLISFALLFLTGMEIYGKKNRTGSVLIVIAVIAIFALNKDIILVTLIEFASQHDLDFLSRKLNEMYLVTQNYVTGDAELRFSLYAQSFEVFLGHPVFGVFAGGNISMNNFCYHSELFDLLVFYGLTGLTVFFMILYGYVKYMKRTISATTLPITYLVAVILLSVLNPVWYSPQIFIGGVMLPVMIYRSERD